jgi:hypothetical protein
MGLVENELTDEMFVKETKKFYTENPDKIATYFEESRRYCVYFDEKTGNKCAIGRILDFEKLEEAKISIEYLNNKGSICNLYDYLECQKKGLFYDLILPSYKNVTLDCMEKMQEWHDELSSDVMIKK